MELYENRSASPMLIAQQMDAFDDPDWIYEPENGRFPLSRIY